MDLNTLPTQALDTLLQHIPSGTAWIPPLVTASIALLGLLFLVRGGRLAPLVTALLCAGGGWFGGWQAAPLVSAVPWMGGAVGAAAGLVLGVLTFRLWLAVQIAAVLMIAGLGAYGVRVQEPLSRYTSQGLAEVDGTTLVTIPNAEQAAGGPWYAEAGKMWDYMSSEVPAFQASFIAIAIATGIAGLVFALLLPKTARSLWAATIGTALLALAGAAVLHVYWPQTLEQSGKWVLLGTAGVWGLAWLWNLRDLTHARRRPKTVAVADEDDDE